MKRIIEDVLEAEAKVNAVLKQAREKAAAIRRSAENEMSEKTNEAKKQAREIVQTAVEDAKREGERIRAEKLEQVEAEKDALLSGRSPEDDEIDGLIDEICNVITTTDKGENSNS
jgi:vacuolar-type H+-ATPase subunit H